MADKNIQPQGLQDAQTEPMQIAHQGQTGDQQVVGRGQEPVASVDGASDQMSVLPQGPNTVLLPGPSQRHIAQQDQTGNQQVVIGRNHEPVASVDLSLPPIVELINSQVPNAAPVIQSERNASSLNGNPFYCQSHSLPSTSKASALVKEPNCKTNSLPTPQPNKAVPLLRKQNILSQGNSMLQRQYALPREDPALEQLTGSEQTQVAPMMSHQPASAEREQPSRSIVEREQNSADPVDQIEGVGSLHTDDAWHVRPLQLQDATMRRSPTSQVGICQNAGREAISFHVPGMNLATGLGGAVGTLHTDDAWHMRNTTQPGVYLPQRMAGQPRQLVEMCTDDVAGEGITETDRRSPQGAYGGVTMDDSPLNSISSSSGDSLEVTEVGATASSAQVPIMPIHGKGLVSNNYGPSRSTVGKMRGSSVRNQVQLLKEENRHLVAQLDERKKESIIVLKECEERKKEMEEQKNKSLMLERECSLLKRNDANKDQELERLRRNDEEKGIQIQDLHEEMQEMRRQFAELFKRHAPDKES